MKRAVPGAASRKAIERAKVIADALIATLGPQG
jgi:hypothetical protein